MAEELTESSQSRGSEGGSPLPTKGNLNLVELAQRIKQKRHERGLTIEQLAASTGLTRSWLSKVENFRVTPSLPALFRIAANLGVTLAELFEGIGEGTDLCVVREGEGSPIERDPSPDNNVKYLSLAHRRTSRGMDPFLLKIPPHGGRQRCLPHDGEEFLMVLSGGASFDYGEDTYRLRQGDCLYFNGSTPHRIYNPHESEAEVLCVFLVSGA
jgi:transcriptional regulator with XRE-family HTH domain